MTDGPRIRAELRGTRRGAARVIYWEPAGKMPLTLFSYIREAGHCFDERRFLAAIVCASAAVELILNKDIRTAVRGKLHRLGGWATLNLSNLRIAKANGLPVETLLGPTEDLRSKPRFVERRNKVAHGDIADMVRNLSDYDPRTEREALDQLEKSQRFVVGWFNTAPDVQGCSIQNYQWPSLP